MAGSRATFSPKSLSQVVLSDFFNLAWEKKAEFLAHFSGCNPVTKGPWAPVRL